MAVTTASPRSSRGRVGAGAGAGPAPTSPRAPATAAATTVAAASEGVATIPADTRSDALPSISTSTSPSTSPSPSPAPSTSSHLDSTSSSYPAHRRPTKPTPPEFLSDKATAAFIRRSLCAHHLADRGRSSLAPIQDLLPPLTSRNDVDLQLYALISIIIREFVQNWYNKITPDETFVAEIVQVIAHCTRALEQRLRKVDLESLLFDELPELLATHIQAYRIATCPAAQSPLETQPHQIYHSLWPLPALSPVPLPDDRASVQTQADNESAYRQLLVHGVLAVLLPTEDLENECLTSLVSQIFSELVIGNLVAGKLSEPWLIWELLIITTRLIRKRDNPNDDPDSPPNNTAPAREPSGSGNSSSSSRDSLETRDRRPWSLHQVFWSFINWIFLMVGLIRLTMGIGVLSWSLPPRPDPSTPRPTEVANRDAHQKIPPSPSHEAGADACTQAMKAPVIRFHIWRCIGDIIEVEARMPWLKGMLSMMQWVALKGPGRVAALDGTLDRLMSHYIYLHVLDPAHLPPLLRAIRAALFPNNAPGVSSLKPPSSGEQLAGLRRRCASALWGLLPRTVGELYYGTSNWRWSRGKDDPITNESTTRRTDPLQSISSTSNHARATHPRGSAGAGPSHVPLPDQNNPKMRSDATLSPRPEGLPQKPNRLAQSPSDYDDDEEERRLAEIETGIVDIFSDAYCNKHLIYSILELLLVRLVPELAEKGVGELWEERLH
ncbi:putative PXA domain-containing protein [Rosellinia necatrix]|uniref:Putative PXA domain-containing protein n=1 Tax=Rosellinia necatrix TaxID=77044 RepID=A0A1W2TRI1_ROSNE|nr:putative PXA domain-containing protein [Rosellinia necatrix]